MRVRSQADAALLFMRWRLSLMHAEVKWLKTLRLLQRKYSDSQPRVPAGHPDGGQWTRGDGGRVQVAQNTSRIPLRVPRTVGGRRMDMNESEAFRYDVMGPLVRSKIEAVRALDPAWRPPAQMYGTSAEDELRAIEATARVADARLRELGGVPPTAERFSVIFPPGLGYNISPNRESTRTVDSSTMRDLFGRAIEGRWDRLPDPRYDGTWYKRAQSDETIGVRSSLDFGVTLDFRNPAAFGLPRKYKVHQR